MADKEGLVLPTSLKHEGVTIHIGDVIMAQVSMELSTPPKPQLTFMVVVGVLDESIQPSGGVVLARPLKDDDLYWQITIPVEKILAHYVPAGDVREDG